MKPTLVAEGATALDVLAECYRAAFDKTKQGREQWIEGTLELAAIVVEAKDNPELAGNAAFSQWLAKHRLEYLHPNDRAALIGIGRLAPTAARRLLVQSTSSTWRGTWEKMPKTAPTKSGKSRKRSKDDWSGSQKKNYIPEVMREPIAPPVPQKRLTDMGLTREQVDPDFKGSALEFATAYGHVNLQNKEQIEARKRQDALMAWVGAVTDHARTAQALLLVAAIDPATLREWMGKTGKADKLRTWVQTIQTACDALTSVAGSP